MPEQDEEQRKAKRRKPLSRLEAMRVEQRAFIGRAKAAEWTPAQPPTLVGRFLIDWLWEAGPTSPGGMGAAAVTWGELREWADSTGIDPLPWQLRIMRRLSQDFVNESHAATKADAKEPWDTQERIRATELQRAALKRD